MRLCTILLLQIPTRFSRVESIAFEVIIMMELPNDVDIQLAAAVAYYFQNIGNSHFVSILLNYFPIWIMLVVTIR